MTADDLLDRLLTSSPVERKALATELVPDYADALTPRAALDALYELKRLRSDGAD